jgi:hypothetical protein
MPRCVDRLIWEHGKAGGVSVILASLSIIVAYAQTDLSFRPFLTSEELALALQVVRADVRFSESLTVVAIDIEEPSKSANWLQPVPDPQMRCAKVLLFSRKANMTIETTVNLRERSVTSWTSRLGVQPPITAEDSRIAGTIVKRDLGWQRAARERGVTDFGKVTVCLGHTIAAGTRIAVSSARRTRAPTAVMTAPAVMRPAAQTVAISLSGPRIVEAGGPCLATRRPFGSGEAICSPARDAAKTVRKGGK